MSNTNETLKFTTNVTITIKNRVVQSHVVEGIDLPWQVVLAVQELQNHIEDPAVFDNPNGVGLPWREDQKVSSTFNYIA
jgi:hypothetical protein